MRAYYRNKDNGNTIELTTIACCDGEYYSKLGAPLLRTGRNERLLGWPDAQAYVYETALGDEFLIPAEKK